MSMVFLTYLYSGKLLFPFLHFDANTMTTIYPRSNVQLGEMLTL